MSFGRVPFLISIYKALQEARRLLVVKSVQSCVSEALIVSHFEEASRGLAILYVLPKSDLRNTFVQNRVNRAINAVPKYKDVLKSVVSTAKADSIILKIFGKGVIKYVDSNSPANFIEFPADAIYLDERDQMNQQNIEMAPDRLVASKWKLQREVGNPSIEDFGVSERWGESSQGIWHIKCGGCNYWQHPDWFMNVVRELDNNKFEIRDREFVKREREHPRVLCRKCGKPLYRFAEGEYVHKYENRKWRGLHVNKIFGAQFELLSDMIDTFFKALKNDMKMQIFFNSALGLPYSSASSKITRTALHACNIADYYAPQDNDSGLVAMGVDVGALFHIVIRKLDVIAGKERKRLLYTGITRNEEDVYKVASKFGVKTATIDGLPETRVVERLKVKMSYLYSCFFPNVKHPTLNKEFREISVDRTTVFDEVKENVDEKVYANFADMENVPDYYEHMQSNTRVYDPDSQRFVWVQSSKDDNFATAEIYCNLAFKLKLSTDIFEFYVNAEKARKKAVVDIGIVKGQTKTEVFKSITDNFYGKSGEKNGKKSDMVIKGD